MVQYFPQILLECVTAGSGIASESVELNHRLLPRVAVAEGIDRPVQEINRVDGHPLLQDAVGLDPASPDGTRAGLHSGPREQ